jgi:hypothetical protein
VEITTLKTTVSFTNGVVRLARGIITTSSGQTGLKTLNSIEKDLTGSLSRLIETARVEPLDCYLNQIAVASKELTEFRAMQSSYVDDLNARMTVLDEAAKLL